VTGDLERKAIATSISALFPRTASDGNPVEWLPAQKVAAATTHRLTPSGPSSGTMKALARRDIAEAAEGEDGSPADRSKDSIGTGFRRMGSQLSVRGRYSKIWPTFSVYRIRSDRANRHPSATPRARSTARSSCCAISEPQPLDYRSQAHP
jgi:hypothetical protein